MVGANIAQVASWELECTRVINPDDKVAVIGIPFREMPEDVRLRLRLTAEDMIVPDRVPILAVGPRSSKRAAVCFLPMIIQLLVSFVSVAVSHPRVSRSNGTGSNLSDG